MQPLTKHREVISGGVTNSVAFTISMKDQSHIKSILRDTLYSDKILAVLREYSANAWDAHRMAGKPDLPIEIQLPTWREPTLIIKDYGTGLSHDDVFNVFAQYGASTKRDSNEAVGMLGIGSKSGFAYSDTFTIISRHNGKQRTYVALLDESENDAISLLGEEDCGDDTGLTIQIAVRNDDIGEFQRKAIDLFQHFNPRPKINCNLPPIPEIRAKLKHGVIFDRELDQDNDTNKSNWFAIMGCIPYRVNLDQLKGPNGEALVSENFRKTSGLLNFDIGQVQINASREELKYSKITKDALIQKFSDLLDEFVTVVLQEIENGSGTNWEKRCNAQILLRLGLGKDEAGDMAATNLKFNYDDLESFRLLNYMGGERGSIVVNSAVRLIRYTNTGRRRLSGYKLTNTDYLIEMKSDVLDDKGTVTKSYTWDIVNAELEKLIKERRMDGIQIVSLDTLPWQPKNPRHRSSYNVNAKHMVSSFKLIDTRDDICGHHKLSDNWAIENRQPTPDDVFVIINGFSAQDAGKAMYNIYDKRKEDARIAQGFGITLPEIYGYKNTLKKPVTPDQVIGIHYPDWRKKFFAELPMDKVKGMWNEQEWSRVVTAYGYGYHNITKHTVEQLQTNLGQTHLISAYAAKGLEHYNKQDENKFQLCQLLMQLDILKPGESEAEIMSRSIAKQYPLLGSNLEQLWKENAIEWQRYVRLIDNEMKDVILVPEEKVED